MYFVGSMSIMGLLMIGGGIFVIGAVIAIVVVLKSNKKD